MTERVNVLAPIVGAGVSTVQTAGHQNKDNMPPDVSTIAHHT